MRILIILMMLAPALAFADGAPTRTPAELRQICADAMNADKSFAQSIIETANAEIAQQHADAADHVAKNERHVILAYAAMWVVAALFVIFLWRRQQALRGEIDRLRADLAAAVKDGK